jgi:predicted extracellular nuclease
MKYKGIGRAVFACMAVVFAAPVLAQSISITALNSAYTQDFNSLANTGTTNTTLPNGWTFSETGTGLNTTYAADTGSTNSGNTYSYGSASSTDRAFGTLLSGSLTSTIGAQFTNDTGSAITGLTISYTGEQWRLGQSARTGGAVDRLDFQYSTTATALNTGTWTDADALDFTSPIGVGTLGALDGNAAANRTAISQQITGLSIPAGATFWIRWTDFNVTGSDDGDAVDDFSLTATGAAAVTPTLTITPATPTFTEGNSGISTATFNVHLDNPAPAGGVAFTINTADGTASASSDYTAISAGSGTIAATQTDTTVSVTINGDTKFEGDETFNVNLTGITGTTNATASAQGTIANDDTFPTVSIADASQNEGASGTSPMNFVITLSAPAPAGGVSVDYATNTGGTNPASTGTDYSSSGGTVNIPENGTGTAVNVGINGDTDVEGDETFLVDLSNPSSNLVIGDGEAVGTILNDDSVVPTFSIDNVSHNEGDTGTTAFTFTITSSVAAPPGGYTVDYASSDDTATTADNDYAAVSGTVSFPPGATTRQVTVFANGDRKFESDEAFKVTLSNPMAGTAVSPTAGAGTGTLQNDDVKPTISMANVSTTEGDSGTKTLDFTVHLATPALEGGVVFDIATADGTATAGSDYVAKSLSGQTIAAGSSDATFSVTINGDITLEIDETFAVNVTATSGTNNPTASATGTITNDDAKPTLTVANVIRPEGNAGTSSAIFTVSLSAISPVNVDFTINTANGTATAGTDYVAIANGSGTITAGSLSTTVPVTINGDTTIEQDETFALNLTAISNAGNTTASATGTITNDDFTIMQLQGDGVATPIASTLVFSTSGIVTAKKASGSGYFIQDPVGDGNPATSDGIFVFGPVAAVAVGDAVTIVAKVTEFSGSTELTSITSLVVNSHGNPLPAPFVFDSHAPSSDPLNGYCMGSIGVSGGPQAHNFACLDGMLVQVDDGIVTGATFGSSTTNGANPGVASGFYGTLAGVAQPYREVGLTYPGAGATIPVFDGNPEVFEVYFPGLNFDGSAHIYNAGAHFSVMGPIQAFKPSGAVNPLYEIYPKTLTDGTAAAPNVQAVNASPAGSLTIGTQNLLHFFNAAADGADTTQYTDACSPPATDNLATDTCPTLAVYNKRLAKMAKQLCVQLKAPAVLNLQEVENASVLNDLKTAVFTECGVTYKAFTFQGNDPGGINTGILVRSDVMVNSVTQLYKGTLTTAGCSGAAPYGIAPCLINDRPPLILDATLDGYHFAFLSIYDRSLSGLEGSPYVGHKRVEEAVQIAKIVQAWQSGATLVGAGNARLDGSGAVVAGTSFDLVGDANVPLVIAGDFNAYEFTDGYADVTGMIMGTAVQNQNTYWDDSGTYVPPSPSLVDSGIKADPAQKYSFNFSGFRQEIDHILMSRLAYKDFLQIGNSHGNSDTSEASPIILDVSTPARSGDHDGQVLTLATDRIFAHDFEAAP